MKRRADFGRLSVMRTKCLSVLRSLRFPIVSSKITSVIRLPRRFIERLKKADGKSVTRNKASLLRLHQKGLPSI